GQFVTDRVSEARTFPSQACPTRPNITHDDVCTCARLPVDRAAVLEVVESADPIGGNGLICSGKTDQCQTIFRYERVTDGFVKFMHAGSRRPIQVRADE